MTFQDVPVGVVFLDITFGGKWRKTSAGAAYCVASVGNQYKRNDAAEFSLNEPVEFAVDEVFPCPSASSGVWSVYGR